jgi:hypothetical protein
VRGLSPWLLGFSLVVGLGWVYHFRDAARGPDEAHDETAPAAYEADADGRATVLVVEVESRDLLERLRRRLPRSSLLVSERDVIAIEGCIFAYDLEKVSAPLNRLGWGDRRIDLVSRPRGPAAAAGALPSAPAAQPGPNLIADLAKKPELTRGDALAMLRELDKP